MHVFSLDGDNEYLPSYVYQIFIPFSRMMSDYTVETISDGLNEFNVEFHGPKESTIDILELTLSVCYSFGGLSYLVYVIFLNSGTHGQQRCILLI